MRSDFSLNNNVIAPCLDSSLFSQFSEKMYFMNNNMYRYHSIWMLVFKKYTINNSTTKSLQSIK